MFVLFAQERNWLALSRPDLPIGAPIIGTTAWPAFLALVPAAECCIIAVPHAAPRGFFDAVRAFRAASPFVPLVVVANRLSSEDRMVLGEVVRPPLQLRRLWPAMQRACTRSLLREGAWRAETADGRSSVLRTAVAMVCRADPPMRSVAELSELAGCHRRTLWRHWQSTGPLASACSVNQLLDWVLVLHACALSSGSDDWRAVATRLGVHRHTLARAAATLAGMALRDLTPDAAPRLRAAFRQGVLDPFDR